MLNGGQKKSRVTKRYVGKEQNEKCANSINVNDRKRIQRKRDRLLGDLRKVFAEHVSISRANAFITCILQQHAVELGWEEKPIVTVGGWGDDPRNWEIDVITLEDRKIMEIANRPIPEELRRAPDFVRERRLSEILSEMKDLRIRSEATKRSLGLPTRLKVRDLLKD
jgi:hypothetical protein